MWSTYLCLLLLAFSVSSGFFAIRSEAAYQNLTYTASGTVPATGYWQIVAADNSQKDGNTGSGYNSRAVSAQTDMVLRVSNTISNLNTSWPNPYYVQFRQTVRFLYYPGVDLTESASNQYRKVQQFEPQFELIDSFQTGYLLEEVRISDTSVVAASGNGWNVTFTINYTYLSGANGGNATPITDFKLRVKQSFIVEGGGDNATIGNNAIIGHKPVVAVNSVSASYGRQRDVSDFQPYAKQNADNLQSLVDGIISDQVAADALDQANDNFVQEAGALQSGQAVLEGAADNSMAAVDFGQVDLIDTYSGSVNFWMSLINQLPTILGAFWSVLIFALIIAFVLFIVRIRR